MHWSLNGGNKNTWFAKRNRSNVWLQLDFIITNQNKKKHEGDETEVQSAPAANSERELELLELQSSHADKSVTDYMVT